MQEDAKPHTRSSRPDGFFGLDGKTMADEARSTTHHLVLPSVLANVAEYCVIWHQGFRCELRLVGVPSQCWNPSIQSLVCATLFRPSMAVLNCRRCRSACSAWAGRRAMGWRRVETCIIRLRYFLYVWGSRRWSLCAAPLGHQDDQRRGCLPLRLRGRPRCR